MTFEEILDQAIAMLQRRGRLTYGTLKRQFQLDDAALEDLKNELIEGQRLARDERGNVLVWTDRADVSPLTTPPASADVHPTQGLPPAAAPHSADAERRHLTVMFCDLVDSTKLSSQLDPEEYRDVVRAYQKVCSEVITQFDGHVAQLLGDGLLVYFGYPHAHEDDAQRAVRTGLGMLDAMGDLNQGLQQAKGIQLAIHMGIHTGLVVVGEMGGAGRQEQLALGEVPNIGSRIEGLAAPNTIAVSEATYRLIQGYFECQDLGAQTLRGVAEPLHVYRVLSESGVYSRLDVAQTRGLTPLVGREQEVGLLLERWEQAKNGQGHVVLLTGDAGIGKSRLVQMLKDHVANEPHVHWECRSSEYYQNTALFPLVDLFQRLLRFQVEDTPDTKLEKLASALSQYRLPVEETMPWLAPLLSLALPEHRSPPLNLSPQRQRQKTLETIVAVLLELAEHQPVLFILEDLHWTDPSTLELLNLVIDQTPTASLLMLLTCRPYFQPAWHHRSYLTEITVNRLSHAQMEQIVNRITDGKALPTEVIQQIIAKADGVPLFVEEMTKAMLESGHLKAVDDHYELTGSFSTLAIPATLQDSLMARLDRLVTAKGIAQMGATIGRQFSYELLQALAQVEAATLQRELGRLVEAELLYQRGVPPQAHYFFKHALIRDAAYESLLKSTRQQYHQRIAQVVEARFPEICAMQPELLAHHYTEADVLAPAIPYWQRAGQRAIERSANVEAISHLSKGLELLTTLPDTAERTQQELDFLTTLGPALLSTKGYAAPEVAQVYVRAREICQQVGDPAQLFLVLRGLGTFYMNRAQLQTARELAEQRLHLAQRQQDPTSIMVAHNGLVSVLYHMGEFAPALTHFERTLALSDPEVYRVSPPRHGPQPNMVSCLSHAAWALWFLGAVDQSLARSQEALALAQKLGQPFNLANGRYWAAQLHQFRRDRCRTHELAEAVMTLSEEQGFAQQVAQGIFLRGWALAEQGQVATGRSQMRDGFAAWQATGAEVLRPYYLAMLAEVAARGGEVSEGLRLLDEALVAVDKSGERSWQAEVHRLKGELLLRQAGRGTVQPASIEDAEAYFHQAIEIARQQSARSLELRAVMSLARLWQQQGQRAAARELLALIYNWFTEGFDTADLQEARVLVEALA